jgi:cholesterol transport system auxiliary component
MRYVTTIATLLLVAGCISSGNLPPREYYVFDDLAKPEPAMQAGPIDRVLLINPTSVNSFYDTQSLVFSRASGQRAYYQFASWTERPGRRFSQLLLHRFNAPSRFRYVASTTADVKGDFVINTHLDELYHDTVATPPCVWIKLTAELIDHVSHEVVARRGFAERALTNGDNASAAVAAFNLAATEMLDELSAWVERMVAQSVQR